LESTKLLQLKFVENEHQLWINTVTN